MRTFRLLTLLVIVFFGSCKNSNGTAEELSDSEKAYQDSVSKLRQKETTDSLKKKNPLLILPPDSMYTGSYVDKYPNGITKFTGFFRLGKRHGQWMSFYTNGEAWSEMHYDKGLRHGPNITYYENGKARYSGMYKNDMKDSTWVYYDSTGKVIEKLIFSKDKMVSKVPAK